MTFFSGMYSIAEKLMWSAVFVLCAYLQVMQQFQTQPINTGFPWILGVNQFMILLLRVMEDTVTYYMYCR